MKNNNQTSLDDFQKNQDVNEITKDVQGNVIGGTAFWNCLDLF